LEYEIRSIASLGAGLLSMSYVSYINKLSTESSKYAR